MSANPSKEIIPTKDHLFHPTGNMTAGPCGSHFKEAFGCFHVSKAEPKGMVTVRCSLYCKPSSPRTTSNPVRIP